MVAAAVGNEVICSCIQVRIQGMGAGAGAHPSGGVSPFKMRYSIAFKHQFIIGRPPLGEILCPPLVFLLDKRCSSNKRHL